MKNILLTILTLALLAAAVLVVPSGSILPEARESYMEESAGDEYDFL